MWMCVKLGVVNHLSSLALSFGASFHAHGETLPCDWTGWKTRTFVWAQSKSSSHGNSTANHRAVQVILLEHQNTDSGQMVVWVTVVESSKWNWCVKWVDLWLGLVKSFGVQSWSLGFGGFNSWFLSPELDVQNPKPWPRILNPDHKPVCGLDSWLRDVDACPKGKAPACL